jgi:hypothetical protein
VRSRAVRLIAVVGVVGLVTASALVASGPTFGATGAKATLHVVRLKPFTVRGSGFKPAERVTVTLAGGPKGTAVGTANGSGTFTVTFSKAAVTACSAYVLHATGSVGSRATFTATLAPACRPTATVDFGATVVVTGTHFRPGERLTVTLVADGNRTRAATASATGSFQVSFGALPLSNCSAYTLRVIGSKGSRFIKQQAAAPC